MIEVELYINKNIY